MNPSTEKMKILVGGGAGYIGSALVPALIEHGYDVTVIDLFWFGNHLPDSAKIIHKDLMKCTIEDFKGYDQFIFMAGLSNDPMAEYSPVANFVYNGAMPSFLAFEAKRAGVKRFIYASSCSVYGYTVDKLYDEDSPATCAYPYGISKLQGERGVFQLQDENFSVISLRQGTVSGYSPRMRMDLVVNTMFKNAMTLGKITINNPSIWRPVLAIEDAVDAYIRAVQANGSISGIFNVASDNYTVGQLGDIVKFEVEKLSDKKVSLEIKNIQDFRNYKVKLERARTYLGFQPRYMAKDIVFDLYEHKDLFGDYKNIEYYNIEVFKKLVMEDIHLATLAVERSARKINHGTASRRETVPLTTQK